MDPQIRDLRYLIPINRSRVDRIVNQFDPSKTIQIVYAVVGSENICINGNDLVNLI